jgi:hypothetical protein
MEQALFPALSHRVVAAAHGYPRARTPRWLGWMGGLTLVLGIGFASEHIVAALLDQPCGGTCVTRPPIVTPLGPAEPFTSSQYGFSADLSNPCEGRPLRRTQSASGVAWTASIAGTQWPMILEGLGSQSSDPASVESGLVQHYFSGAKLLYPIPGAEIGYHTGHGGVYSMTVAPPGGRAVVTRVVVEVSSFHGLTLDIRSMTPYSKKLLGHGPDYNPSSTIGSVCLDQVINTVTWPGEAPL